MPSQKFHAEVGIALQIRVDAQQFSTRRHRNLLDECWAENLANLRAGPGKSPIDRSRMRGSWMDHTIGCGKVITDMEDSGAWAKL